MKGPTVKKFLMVASVLALGVAAASAQLVTDPNTLVVTAKDTANSVMALCITVGGFFLVFKIVKWIRK